MFTTTQKPTNKQLIIFIEEQGLNVIEAFNYDCTDIDQYTLDAETYLFENYDAVLAAYEDHNA